MTVTFGTGSTNSSEIESMIGGSLIFPGETPEEPKVQPNTQSNTELNVSQAFQDVQIEYDLPVFGEETPKDPLETVDELPEELENVSEKASENWKKVRNNLKAANQARRELEEQLVTERAELEKYRKGEAVPDIVRAKDERIAQLEPLEAIMDFKLSREYQSEIVAPATELRGKLDAFSRDYGVPEEVTRQAVGIDNLKDRNQFLSRHFGDVGALEVKGIIKELHDLGTKALEMEAQPRESLTSLKAKYQERQQAERANIIAGIEITGREAWSAALNKVAEEGAFPQLIMRKNESPTSEYNKKIAANQALAATQYGAFMKEMVKAGATNISPEFAMGVARNTLLSIMGAKNLKALGEAEQRSKDLLANTRRTSTLSRPSPGSSNGNGHSSRAQPQGTGSFREAGDRSLDVFRK